MSNEQIERLLALHRKQPVESPVEVWHSAAAQAWPPVNLLERGGELYLSAELPGYDHLDLHLSVNGDRLTFSAPEPPRDAQTPRYVHRERGRRGFSRSLRLPFLIDAQAVRAELTDGVLTIALPPLGSEAGLGSPLS